MKHAKKHLIIYDEFYLPNDEGGIAWNDLKIGMQCPEVVGDYPGSADPSR